MMEDLILEFQTRIARTQTAYTRYLYGQIDLNNRLIAIKGARGIGKTTLLMQLAKNKLPVDSTLYVSLEHIYFYENNLYELAKRFHAYGGTHLLLDEVHKYPKWSREIKLIYDNFSDLNIIFTSSSILEILQSESDLSRRMISYHLKELSFREFIYFEKNKDFPKFELVHILSNHNQIASEIIEDLKPLPLFMKYLQMGAYPYYKENETWFKSKLMHTVDLIIETDVPAVERLDYDSLLNMKKLLRAIASSAPFVPNISKLSSHIGISRNQLVAAIKILERSGLLIALYKNNSGIGALTKPEKLFLNNTNLMYALDSNEVNVGNLRETFFVNQITQIHEINLAETTDFIVDRKFSFEIGGKNKRQKQIQGLNDAYIVKDEIEVGAKNIIPLWLFGFLY